MISNDDKNKVIQKIIDSEIFSRSEISQRLLQYLFQADISNIHPKEINIAIDVFDRTGDFYPSEDTVVRVNIHNLRKRLDEYYRNEGKDEKLRIQIPKGKYCLQFLQNKKNNLVSGKSSSKIIFVSAILIIILNATLWFLFSRDKIGEEANPVWKEYLQSKNDLYIVLGDPFFFRMSIKELGKSVIVRDVIINSQGQLDDNKAYKNDEFKVGTLPVMYYSNNNIQPLPYLFDALKHHDGRTVFSNSSQVSIEEIKNNNVILLSSVRSMGLFEKFLESTSLRVGGISNSKGIQRIHENDTIVYSAAKSLTDYFHDYAFMVKIPSPNNSTLTIVADYHAMGNSGLVEFMSQDDAADKILRQFPELDNKFPKYFEMIVKVNGLKNDNLFTEVVYFKPLVY